MAERNNFPTANRHLPPRAPERIKSRMGNLARRAPKKGVFLHIFDKSPLGHPAYNLIAMVKHPVIVISVVPTALLCRCRRWRHSESLRPLNLRLASCPSVWV